MNSKKIYYAHSLDNTPKSQWQPLDEHLVNVAKLAQEFARVFGAPQWGYLAGLWHDIGKHSDEFQKRLEGGPRVDHATAGAKYAIERLSDKNIARLLSYALAGHHSGMPDGKSNNRSCLEKRLKSSIPDWSAYRPEEVCKEPGNPPLTMDRERFPFQLSFFIRMIYSCLVDADFLDTEAFMNREKSTWRRGCPGLEELNKKLSIALKKMGTSDPSKAVNKKRAEIQRHCLKASELRQGLFSLTVPTGGGKTLSSLAFALKHAIKHSQKRIIYVIPYTSIIEQNAAVFREILGEDAVVEHHSNFDPKSEREDEYSRSNLATENWDAPLIVTTNVQFFESLFNNRSSKCRKLHNIANSVVILDEAQMLPVQFLKPCLEVLRELSSSYNTSIVLCTATQPALSTSDTFKNGLNDVQEIIPDPAGLYNSLKRVDVAVLGKFSDDDLAGRLMKSRQVLCVVNTRKHARTLYEKIGNCDGHYHLSALMYPEHRSATLKNIRRALADGAPCRVISTQLIEAGVDIDFPVVFRSAAGIDSVAQAAGRCNREGRLTGNGKVYVFTPEDGLPSGHFRQTAEVAESVMRGHNDILSLNSVSDYFRELYWRKGDEKLDEKGIIEMLGEDALRVNFDFKKVARSFQLIENSMEPIIIPRSDEAEKIVEQLRDDKYTVTAIRKLQRYTIQVDSKVISALKSAGSVESVGEEKQFSVLCNKDIYRDDLGLCPEDPTFHEAGSLIFDT